MSFLSSSVKSTMPGVQRDPFPLRSARLFGNNPWSKQNSDCPALMAKPDLPEPLPPESPTTANERLCYDNGPTCKSSG